VAAPSSATPASRHIGNGMAAPGGTGPRRSATPPTESTPSQNVLIVKAMPCAISAADSPQLAQRRKRTDAPVTAAKPTFMLSA